MVDVVRPGNDTDPIQVSDNRDLPAPARALEPERNVSEEIPTLPPVDAVNAGTIQPQQSELINLPTDTPDRRPDVPVVNIEDASTANVGQAQQYVTPAFQHPQLQYPTINPALQPGPNAAQLIQEVLTDPVNQLNALELPEGAISRINNLNSLSARYTDPSALTEHYRNRIHDTNTVAARRAAGIQSMMSPPGEGIAGTNAFTRNVMSGRPFHPMTEDAIREAQRTSNPGESILDVARLVRDYVKFRWNETTTALTDRDEFLRLQQNRQVRREQILRGLSADIVAGAGRLLIPELEFIPESVRNLRRNVVETLRGPTPVRGGLTPMSTRVQSDTLSRFYNQSPTFQRLIEHIEPTLDSNGEAIFNPLQGHFGDFGSAGALSGLLYLANIPEGVLTGGLYEITNLIGDGISVLRNGPVSHLQNIPTDTRPNIGSAFIGRDLGIMQRYREDNYLSFVGNPALQWLPRKGQWYAGFLADMAIGGIADAPIDALLSLRRARRLGTNVSLDPVTRQAALQSVDGNVLGNVSYDALNRFINNSFATRQQTLRMSREASQAVMRQGATTQGASIRPVTSLPDPSNAPLAQEATQFAQRVEELTHTTLSIQSIANANQSFDNTVNAIQDIQRQLRDNYRTTASAIVLSSGSTVNGNVITNPTRVLDALIPSVDAISLSPGFARYADALDTYRLQPDIPAQALDFIRRTDTQLIDLAKRYGILEPDEQFVSSMRLRAMQELYPDLLAAWGKPLGENTDAPMLRLLTPADPVQGRPQESTLVDAPPILRAINPDGSETMQSIYRRFDRFVAERPYLSQTDNNPIDLNSRRQAREVVQEGLREVHERLSNVTSLENHKARRELDKIHNQILNADPRDFRRIEALEDQALRILEDNPGISDDLARASLPPNLVDLQAETAEIDQIVDDVLNDRPVVLREAQIASDLRNQLDEVKARVTEQEQILNQQPPLEREPVAPEAITRQNYDNVIDFNDAARARNTSADTVNVVDFNRNRERVTSESIASAVRELGGEDELISIPALRERLNISDDAAFDKAVLTAWERGDIELNQLEEITPEIQPLLSEGIQRGDGSLLFWASVDPPSTTATPTQAIDDLFGDVDESELDALLTDLPERPTGRTPRGTPPPTEPIQGFNETATSSNVPAYSALGDELNAYLRTGQEPRTSEQAFISAVQLDYEQAVFDTDYGLLDSEPFVGTTYRGFRREPEDFAIGQIIYDEGYLSTSRSREVAERFRRGQGVMMEVTGQNGRDIKAVNMGEQEILFPRETRFRVDEIDGDVVRVTEIDDTTLPAVNIGEMAERNRTAPVQTANGNVVEPSADIDSPVDTTTELPDELLPQEFSEDEYARIFNDYKPTTQDLFDLERILNKGDNVITMVRRHMSRLSAPQQDKLIRTVNMHRSNVDLVFLADDAVETVDENILRSAYMAPDGRFAVALRKTDDITDVPPPTNLTDEQMLVVKAVRNLDRQNENYLPIFRLRDRVRMSRQELDHVLLGLQDEGVIGLHELTQPQRFTGPQIRSAISVSGADRPLFYITLNAPAEEALTLRRFHGTKGVISHLSDMPSGSLSNELGFGLYLTDSVGEAQLYARAMPSKDSVQLAQRVARPTPKGRVYPVTIRPDALILDINKNRSAWRTMLLEELSNPQDIKRFRTWSAPSQQAKHKPEQFLHYIRSQYIKRLGKDAYASSYQAFLNSVQTRLRIHNYDGLSYDNVTNIVDLSAVRIGAATEDAAATGSLTENFLARYHADTVMHGRVNNTTTKAILADDRLDMDTHLLQNIEEAVGEQERVTFEAMRQVMKKENELNQQRMWQLVNEENALKDDKINNIASRERRIISTQEDDCF